MKNSIFFKFLAVLLCAASLLGIVGGAAGALVLAEGDLYNQTVEQMLDEKLQGDASIFAEQTALAYASRELGGCPEDMSHQRYGMRLDCDYGYAILDAEGNVLESQNPELKDSGAVYEVPVVGQYMHLVSTETESEIKAREAAQRADLMGRGMEVMDNTMIPPEGLSVNQVWFTDAQGNMIYEAYGDQNEAHSVYYHSDYYTTTSSGYDHDPQGRTGFLFCGADGQIMYHSFLWENEYEFPDTEIYGVMFMSHDGDFYFSTENPDGLGVLFCEGDYLRFVGYAPEEIPEETLPETIPETTAETVPEETVEETIEETKAVEEKEEKSTEATEAPKETQPEETVPSSASAVPEESEGETDSKKQDKKEDPSEKSDEKKEASAETTPAETVTEETVPQETIVEETEPPVTEPVLINGKPLETYQVNRTEYHDNTRGEQIHAKYVYLPMPEMTVEVYLDRDTMGNAEVYDVLRLVRQYRNYLLPAIGICLLVFAVTAVYLCTAAGRKPKTDEIRASGLNRLPLDLYLGLGIFAGTGIAALAIYGTPVLLRSDFLLGCSAAAGATFGCCLLITAYLFAFVAQVKTPGGFWWRNLLCIRFVFLCMRLLQWLERWLREKGLPALGRLTLKAWQWILKAMIWLYKTLEKTALWVTDRTGRFFRRTGRTLNRWFSLMPLTWQWMVSGMFLIFLLFLGLITDSIFLLWLGILSAFGLVLYGSHCFGVLLESTKKMGQGDLDTKVDDKLMVGCFQEFAGDLNNLADVAMVAAQKQLKSERMKTELITNVSHDIKTPLTSIINYVDLLQKPHTEEEGEQYLEVLDRQSQRLKKLVEDLMDMSKASTGNMAVEITRVDAVESVNQALGEFSDKLERAHLYPVFRHNEDSVPMMADGKLVWRVLSNLLGNAVKYAMPGTRVYLDLTQVDGKVVISLKNISRDELNVDADELMERFVRGDVSRNTEGSGLGLNIAKSLMELQKGQLQMLVDGDLFKVTLFFPAAE